MTIRNRIRSIHQGWTIRRRIVPWRSISISSRRVLGGLRILSDSIISGRIFDSIFKVERVGIGFNIGRVGQCVVVLQRDGGCAKRVAGSSNGREGREVQNLEVQMEEEEGERCNECRQNSLFPGQFQRICSRTCCWLYETLGSFNILCSLNFRQLFCLTSKTQSSMKNLTNDRWRITEFKLELPKVRD